MIVSKKLEVQAKILSRVESVILRGFTRPSEITKKIDDINDDHTAKIYLESVESMWLEKNINPKLDRLRIIKKSELFERERSGDAEKTKNENAKVGFFRLALDALKFQAKILGLESMQIEDIPSEGLSDETMEKLNRMYAMNNKN